MSNQVLDLGLLAQTAAAAMAVADRGYFKIEDIEACGAVGVTAYVPKPIRGPGVREGFFGKDVFRYEPDRMSSFARLGQRSRRATGASRATM
ncbi:hypothetical protein [Sphingomonas faeni]|uniref:hypothetical protein n=1 Tax=Sphingomonas faeni TaxID=185950 RepID=UPI00278370A0|nr:hypothetical protein [Sphingomonas faeni]MDQ0839254.1 hypothetical protein [Sphingomonas faeni]